MSSIEKAIERLSKTKSAHQVDTAAQAPRKISSNDSLPVDRLTETKSTPENNQISETLSLSMLPNMQYLVPGCTNKPLSEEYRGIKRPVLMNALGKSAAPIQNANLVGITSSLPGEGKTYTALNLALSMATELNSTILLIDGDVLRSSLSMLLGIEKKPGLTDLLSDPTIHVSDVLVPTQIPKLKIIPAGTKFDNTTELMASDGMEKLVKELGDRYANRIVLFDTPPVLSTNQTRVLIHLMGQILIVVEACKTPLDALKDTLSQISENKVVGMILNKTDNRFGMGGYGAYGKYAAGYY
jgi:receptor protein-tyrosine kinase